MVKFNKETITQIFKDIKRVINKYKDFQSGSLPGNTLILPEK